MKQHLLRTLSSYCTEVLFGSIWYYSHVLLKLQWLCYEDFNLFYFTFFYQIMLNVLYLIFGVPHYMG